MKFAVQHIYIVIYEEKSLSQNMRFLYLSQWWAAKTQASFKPEHPYILVRAFAAYTLIQSRSIKSHRALAACIPWRKVGKLIGTGPEVIKHFLCSTQLSTKFILLINVKMPTLVGILTFISMINTTSERLSK